MRTEGDLIKINDWLLPLSWIYGSIVRFRNWLFDIGSEEEQAILDSRHLGGQYHRGRFGKDPPCGILDTPVARQGENCRAITWLQDARATDMYLPMKIRQCRISVMSHSRCTRSSLTSM